MLRSSRLSLLGLSACIVAMDVDPVDVDPVVGTWANERNRPAVQEWVFLHEDGTGMDEVTVLYNGGEDSDYITFDLEWSQVAVGQYDVLATCATYVEKVNRKPTGASCADFDPKGATGTLECHFGASEDRLVCGVPSQPETTLLRVTDEENSGGS